MPVKLFVNKNEVAFQKWNFPGGEVGVKLIDDVKYTDHVVILLEGIVSSEDIFVLLNLANAVYNVKTTRKNTQVYIPYFPYARQDRICNHGESNALEVFIAMIRSLEWSVDQVVIVDAHSQITERLLYKLTNVDFKIVNQEVFANKTLRDFHYDVIVAPDKGALEKAQAFRPEVKHVFLSKTRQGSQVIYEDYPEGELTGKCLVIDDICDGGATFVSLGEMLRRTQPKIEILDLYVTHGIFSRGLDKLYSIYDNVHCFNNMQNLDLTRKNS